MHHSEAAGDVPAVVIKYGAFAQTVIDFLIVAIAIFLIIKLMNKAQRKQEEPEETDPTSEELLVEIHDLLKR